MNECGSCGRDFASVAAFDRHRSGVHAYTYIQGMRMDPQVEDGRRCLDDPELQAVGLELNAKGRWHDPERAAAARAAFGK